MQANFTNTRYDILLCTGLFGLLCGSVQAQNAIWSYDVLTGIISDARYGLAADGDLLAGNVKLGSDGAPVWERSYSSPGAILDFGMLATAQVNDGLMGLCVIPFATEYYLATVRMDAAGVPQTATRIVDPSAIVGPGIADRIAGAPDGGWLVIKDNTYRFNADGTLRWARQYDEYEAPRSVCWTPDGGFYATANGAGIVRYDPDGVPVRVMTTGVDTYDDTLALTVKHPVLLHENTLYVGIGTPYLTGPVFRSNMGVMMMDTMGTLQGQLMNHELLSPYGDNALGTLVTLTIAGDRLHAAMMQTSAAVGQRNYLMDCALDLSDPHWYAAQAGTDHFLAAAFTAPDDQVVLAGGYDNDLMQVRLVPGSDLSDCYVPLPYAEAPLVLQSQLRAPEASGTVAVTLEPIEVSSTLQEQPDHVLACGSIAVDEQQGYRFQLFPNPANNEVTMDLGGTSQRCSFDLRDATGSVVFSSQASGARTSFAIGHLAAGMYTLTLDYGNGLYHTKLSIVR